MIVVIRIIIYYILLLNEKYLEKKEHILVFF